MMFAVSGLLLATGLVATNEVAMNGLPGGQPLPPINEVAELPPIVVEASRIDARAETMPAAVRVLETDAIGASGARDVPELLEKSANVEIRRFNANPLQSQIAMRGFGEYSYGRVKVLLDGEELNEVDMEMPDLARVPIGSVTRVEIIPGPSPVLYGDGAVAGVVNIITAVDLLSPPTLSVSARAGSQGTFGANVQTRGGQGLTALPTTTNHQLPTTNFGGQGLTPRIAPAAQLASLGGYALPSTNSITYSAAYDYEHSDGYRERSAYDIHSLNAALKKHFTNGSFVGIRANYENARYEMPGAISFETWQHDRTAAAYQNDWCRTWNYGVGLTAKAKLADEQWLYCDATYSQKHRHTNWGDYGYANEYDLYGFFLTPRYVNEMRLGRFDNTFTLGADFRYDWYGENGESGEMGENNFRRLRYAFYANEEFFLTDKLSFTAGARLEVIDNRTSKTSYLEPQTSNLEPQTSVLGDYELAVVWRPADGLKTYAKGTRFHRSPFCDEMTYTEDGSLLEPETGWSLDIGAEYKFLREFSASLNGYGMIIDDEIFYDPYAKDYGGYFGGYNCNSPDRTRRIGFDAAFGWKRDKVAEASIQYGFVHAQFSEGDYGGCDVPLVPANRVRVEVGVWIFDDLEIKGGYRFVSSRRLAGDFANEHGEMAGYSLFDAGAYYEPSWAQGWRLTFTIDNIFDCDYCDYAGWSDGSGAYCYPARGRSFMFTLGWTF